MNKNIQFSKNSNIVSLVCPQLVIFDDKSLKYLNSMELDSSVQELSIQLLGCNFKDNQLLTGLLDLINKFIKIEKLKIIFGFENTIFISQFQYLVNIIGNLQNLQDLILQFDSNVLDLDQYSVKQQKYQEMALQKMKKIKKLELTINKSNPNKNIDIAIHAFICHSINIQNLKLDIKDNKLNQQQLEKIYSDLNKLTLLYNLQFSITNNEEAIQYKSFIKTLYSKKLDSISIKLENCAVNYNKQTDLERNQNLSLRRIDLNYNKIKNVESILQDSLQSLNCMLGIEDVQIIVEQCDIEDLEIFIGEKINQLKELKQLKINLLQTNITSKVYLELLKFISKRGEQFQQIKLFFNIIQITLECKDQNENIIILNYENLKSKNIQNLAQELNGFFKMLKEIPTVSMKIFGPLQYGFKFNNNTIQQLIAEVLNCQENFIFFQDLIKSADNKALKTLHIDFKFTSKSYQIQTKEFENIVTNFLHVKKIFINLEKISSFSRAMFGYLSELLKKQSLEIEVTFELDNKLEQEENIFQDILGLSENISDANILDIKFDLLLKYLIIEAKKNEQKRIIKLKIYLKKLSLYLLKCFIKTLPKIKGLRNVLVQIFNQQNLIKMEIEKLELIGQDSFLQITNNVDDNYSILYYFLENPFVYLCQASSLSLNLKDYQILREIIIENPKEISHFHKIKSLKINLKHINNIGMSLPYNYETYNFVVQSLNLIDDKYIQKIQLNFFKDQEITSCENSTELERIISNFKYSNNVCLDLLNAPCFSESFILYFSDLIKQQSFSVKANFNLKSEFESEVIIQHILILFQKLNSLNLYSNVYICLRDNRLRINVSDYSTYNSDYKFLDLNIICKNKIQNLILNLLNGKGKIKNYNYINLTIQAEAYEFQIQLDQNQDKNYIQDANSNQNEQNYIHTKNEYDLLDIILQQIQNFETIQFLYSFDNNLINYNRPFLQKKLNIELKHQNQILNLSNFVNLKILSIIDNRDFQSIQPIAQIFEQVFLHTYLESFQYNSTNLYLYQNQNQGLNQVDLGQFIQIDQAHINKLRVLKIKTNSKIIFDMNFFKRKMKKSVVIKQTI
ncbi:hypothetical protein ABPG72_007804 [Tetrahymena utriculariae]